MKRNQKDHLLQWLIIVMIIELFLFLIPIKLWLGFVLIGIAFMGGFLLRLFKIYPGEREPLVVDFSTALIAFLASYFISLIEGFLILLVSKIFTPFIILIPHFVYIANNKKIKPPVLISIIKRLFKKIDL